MSARTGIANMERALTGESDIRLFLLFGPEESMAEDFARTLAAKLGSDVERIDIDGSDLRSDPARLPDEAASISLFGGQRYIRLRLGGNDPVGPLETLLDAPEAGTPVIATAGNLTKANKLRKLAESHKRALTHACYAPNEREAVAAIHARASEAGLRLSRPHAQAICDATHADPIIAAQEIEKLVLYLDASPEKPGEVTDDILAALGTQTAEDDISGLVHVVMSGKLKKLGEELAEARFMGLNAIRIVKALERRVGQLIALRTEVDGGHAPSQVVSSARNIFFKEKDHFTQELQLWPSKRLAYLNHRLIALEGSIMSAPGSLSDTLLGEALTAICRAANQAGRSIRG